MAKTENRKPKY